MLDSIKQELQEKAKQRRNLVPELYEQSTPTRVNNQSSTLADLEDAVIHVNQGQQQLDVITKMNESSLYRSWIGVVDGFERLFGKENNRITNIYDLFSLQQQNVRTLNQVLAGVIYSFDSETEVTRKTLDSLVHNAGGDVRQVHQLESHLPSELKRYEDLQKKLKSIDAQENPEEYYSTFRASLLLRRKTRKQREHYIGKKMVATHNESRIQHLSLQEEIFSTLLEHGKLIAVGTELYQRELDDNARYWKSAHNLATALHMVRGGIKVLDSFNNQLSSNYTQAIQEISSIAAEYRSNGRIDQQNTRLQTLLDDVNTSAYQTVGHLT